MKVLATFQHDGKEFEVRSYFDEQNQEHVARAYSDGKPVDGIVYTCNKETYEDAQTKFDGTIKADSKSKFNDNTVDEIFIDAIKDDIATDRWNKLVEMKLVK